MCALLAVYAVTTLLHFYNVGSCDLLSSLTQKREGSTKFYSTGIMIVLNKNNYGVFTVVRFIN